MGADKQRGSGVGGGARILRACVVLAVLSSARQAAAQRGSYEHVAFGGRASGMAGAAIALADEPSAAFYNPAGLAQLDVDILALSVQGLGGVVNAEEGLVRVDGATAPASTTSFGALSTSAAYSFPLGAAGTLGFSLVTPVISDVSHGQGLRSAGDAVDVIVESDITDKELLLGPSFAVRAGPAFFGATLYVEYASIGLDSLQVVAAPAALGGRYELHRTRRSSGEQVGLTGIFGALVRFDEHWSGGLRLRFPNLPVYSTSTHTFVESETKGGVASRQTTLHDVEGTMRYPHPFGLGLGAGYRARRMTVAFDVTGYLPMLGYDLFGGASELGAGGAQEPWDPTLAVPESGFAANVALGLEVFLVDSVSLLMGARADTAALPSATAFDVAGATTMTFVGATVGARYVSEAGTFTLALAARQGAGKIDSLAWRDGALGRGEPGSAQQTTGTAVLSFTRSLTADWVALQKQLNTLVGR
ncbi:MAG: hypothetical protein IT373_09330 [Polyangiaceae bacterium]|nr:hypothetical protein [Polyangiaceae bacterium]